MTKFEKTKLFILERAAELGACEEQSDRIQDATTNDELLEVIKDNIGWIYDAGVRMEVVAKLFKESDLIKFGIGNIGEGNTGFSNAGNRNAGNRNAGYSNAGNRNAGYSNAGYSNAGNYNAGNRNSGYSNAGNDNAGAFNNLQANYVMFNKPSNWTYQDFISSTAYAYLSRIDTTIYVPSSVMSEKEKSDHPYHVTTGGYIKNLPYKEAFTSAWNNWSESVKQSFKDLPNFDPEVFEDITGVKI